MTQACADEMDNEEVEILHLQVRRGRRRSAATSKTTSTRQSALTMGNDYQVLQCLARRHNLHIGDVPGDANSFFNAVSASLPTTGIQAISGPDIQARLINFLETSEFSHEYASLIP